MAQMPIINIRMVPDGATVWLALRMNVYRNPPPPPSLRPVEVLGVFAGENEAVEACTTPYDICGPVNFNEIVWDSEEWKGAYYPKGQEE